MMNGVLHSHPGRRLPAHGVLLACLFACLPVHATSTDPAPVAKARPAPPLLSFNNPRRALPGKPAGATGGEKPVLRAPPAAAASTQADGPLVVTTIGSGQGGYVHYFLLDTPEGTRESHIGIELPDGRIAWSFPELGVVVVPFIESGEIDVSGRIYSVRHLYGLRPFRDGEAMRALQKELVNRIIPWIEDGTPYCNPTVQPKYLCASCLGFVLRVLFPGRTPAYPALPADFGRNSNEPYYTTDDLLLYLTGVHALDTTSDRLKRIEGLALPLNLHEDLIRLASAAGEQVHDAPAAADKSRNLTGKGRPRAGSYSKSKEQRPAGQDRKL